MDGWPPWENYIRWKSKSESSRGRSSRGLLKDFKLISDHIYPSASINHPYTQIGWVSFCSPPAGCSGAQWHTSWFTEILPVIIVNLIAFLLAMIFLPNITYTVKNLSDFCHLNLIYSIYPIDLSNVFELTKLKRLSQLLGASKFKKAHAKNKRWDLFAVYWHSELVKF